MYKNESHLVAFSDKWSIWKDFCLRGSGFDAKLILELSADKSADISQKLHQTQLKYNDLRRNTFQLINDEYDKTPKSERKILLKTKDKLWKNNILVSDKIPANIQAKLNEIKELKESVEEMRKDFGDLFEEEFKDISSKLWEIGQKSQLQEAIIWQNRKGFLRSIRSWLQNPLDLRKITYKKRATMFFLTNYLQRYTTKNDTIGFFGPVAWGNIQKQDSRISIKEGKDFLAYRQVFSEGWAIDSLTRTFSADLKIKMWLKPRRFPFIRLKDNKLYVKDSKPQNLPPQFAYVLGYCNGSLNAHTIIEKALSDKNSFLTSDKEIQNILMMLEKREIISWSMEIPWVLDIPNEFSLEEKVFEQIEQIEDDGIRKELLTKLKIYQNALEHIRASAGHIEELNKSLARLEDQFTELTGKDAERHAGKTYGGRTIVFEDCRRDISVTVGDKMIEDIKEPLKILLAGARWLTCRTLEVYQEAFHTVYDEINERRNDGSEIDFFEFWNNINALFFHETENLAKQIVPEFQEKWQKLLDVSNDKSRINYSSAELIELVNKAFYVDKSDIVTAKYNCPDIMIAAKDIESINKGDCLYVMGEIHLGVNTLLSATFLRVHENPSVIMESFYRDFPNPRFIIIPPKEMVTSRNFPVFNITNDYYLAFSEDATDLGAGNLLQISDLIVEKINGELFVSTRNGELNFPIQNVFADVLCGVYSNLFSPIAPKNHIPRIQIDKLVIQRETWRFPISEMSFANESDPDTRYLEAQLWRHQVGLPRFVFIKLSNEIKPFYVDFNSPFLLENFFKQIRNLHEQDKLEEKAIISEMLPDFENLWLTNRDGEKFTSEFRLVFVENENVTE